MVDFFISYTKSDLFQARIIYNWLIDEGYSCKMQDTDFDAGSNFVLEMQSATKDCKKTIAILSPEYLNSNFTQPEWAAAFVKDPTGNKRKLIPIRIKDCEPDGLLASIVYIDLVGLDAISQRKKVLEELKRKPNSKSDLKNNGKKEIKNTSNKDAPNYQTIIGSNNLQIAGDYNVFKESSTKKILPSRDSIGGDPLLKQRIQTLFNKIGESREKRFGKKAYQIMYSNFKSDFGIKNNSWTIIWMWPKECAQSIINYLQIKFDNTIEGRIQKAAKKSDYFDTRPQLYKKEKEYLAQLGLEMNSDEVRDDLESYFGTRSHKNLTHLEHWQWVKVLESRVSDLEK